ncbi:flagellar protein export ATPase FliI [Nordella sp. HKS 07]|uniref:flagellar protein export ATPase FliI n=1 Tax=Nordella sp. HKS 07 TaxID=2712222 RepID=UPI00352F8DBC
MSGAHALLRLENALATARAYQKLRIGGRIKEVTPAHYRVCGLAGHLMLGEQVCLEREDGPVIGEVVRLDETGATIKSYDKITDAGLGEVAWRLSRLTISPSHSWKGRIINALGEPVDGRGSIVAGELAISTDRLPPQATKRRIAKTPLATTIRVVDLFTPLCAGQRIGVFAGSGIGKTTLLSMFARAQGFDTVVVALVGERGREVREFAEVTLKDSLERAVVVVATSDESAMLRRQAPQTAMAVAEYFRDRGESVLLIVDSVTRYAHACREIALAAGEPPVARGYAPSVFGDIPRLLERAGPGEDGSGAITGIFSVLVDGDDHNEPIADTVRGILDGHIVLDRAIAEQGRFPAVNVLTSVSRLAHHAWTTEQRGLISKLRALIARFEDTRDLRLLGGYQPGSDTELDQAVQLVPIIYEAVKQGPDSPYGASAFRDLADALAAQTVAAPQS